MTLTHRPQKPRRCRNVVTDVENSFRVSPSTSPTTKAKSSQLFCRWIPLRHWRIWSQRRLVFVAAYVLVVLMLIGLCFPNYWTGSNTLSPQQIFDLQHMFPAHINTSDSDEMESIANPAHLLSNKERLKGITKLDLAENITVPKFWNPPAFRSYEGGVREFLGNRGKRLITPAEASTIGSFNDDKQTIFVAVTSYRDPECRPTVESVFARAKHPERIRVAIVDQRSRNELDPSCQPPDESLCQTSLDITLCRYVDQIDYIEYDSIMMSGPIFARHIANRMYRGEYFALQVDSHVRFVVDWDQDIINQWESIGNEMAVISTYMTDISDLDPVTNKSRTSVRSIMCDFEYEWTSGGMAHIKFNKQPNGKPRVKDSPMLHPFWAAGFSFSRGHFVVSVPYDHYLPFVFQGEEILQTIRGFSFGYDFYAPLRNVAYHIYGIKKRPEKQQSGHRYTENIVLYGNEVKMQAYLRLIGISGTTDPPSDYLHLEEERYGSGHVRSRKLFFDVFGIHPNNRTIEKNLCDFVQGRPASGAPRSMHTTFKPFLRYDKMGIDYSRISYRHKTPEKVITKVDKDELASLQAKLREEMQKLQGNSRRS